MTDTRMQPLVDNQTDKMEVEEKEDEVVATIDTVPTALDVVDSVSTSLDVADAVPIPVDVVKTVPIPLDVVKTVPTPQGVLDSVPTPIDFVDSNIKQSHTETQEISQDQKTEAVIQASSESEAMEVLPSTETSILSTETVTLSKKTSITSTETSIPSTETSVPCNETSKQPNETSNSSTETSIPSNETSIPSKETCISSTETIIPSTVTIIPSTENSIPSTETIIPSTVTSIPSTETSIPSTETSIPSNETSIPSNGTSIPSTTPSIPSNDVTLSDNIPSKVNEENKIIPSDETSNIPLSNQVSENVAPESLIPVPAASCEPAGEIKSEIAPPITENAQNVSENAQKVMVENIQGITINSQDITDSINNDITENTDDGITETAQETSVNAQEIVQNTQEITEAEHSETGQEIHNCSEETMSATENDISENLQEMREECSPSASDQVVNESSSSEVVNETVVNPVYSMVEGGDVVAHNNVISIPEFTVDDVDDPSSMADIKLEPRTTFTIPSAMTLPSQITLSSGSTLLINHNQTNILAAAMAGANVGGQDTTTTTSSKNYVKIEPSALGMLKPPSTDALLKTAKEVLQLQDEPNEYRRFFTGPGNILVDSTGNIVHTNDQSLSICSDEVSGMEVSDENGTYILESVNGGEFYEDPNIMWIEETVEVEQESYDGLSPMVIILNPNGTVNEELMLANGMNMETIKAVTDAASGGLNLQTVLPNSTPQPTQSITSLQHPIPKRFLTGVQPVMSSAPRSVIDAANETQRSVILDQKEDYLILDDIKDPMLTAENGMKHHQTHRIVNIKGTQHIITTSKPIPDLRKINSMNIQSLMNTPMNMTPLGTLDLSMPKKEPGFYAQKQALDQFVNPSALVSEHTVLKVLDQSKQRNNVTKIRRPRMRDENGNGSPYIHRKTTSLGALGQALHGTPRDSRENAVQICPICKFQATTKNPYRHLQDHLARVHFKDRIAAELPTKKPYVCPFDGCDGKAYPDWQAVMRHYIGKKHGILDKYVKEELCQIRRENGGRIPGTIIRPGVELML